MATIGLHGSRSLPWRRHWLALLLVCGTGACRREEPRIYTAITIRYLIVVALDADHTADIGLGALRAKATWDTRNDTLFLDAGEGPIHYLVSGDSLVWVGSELQLTDDVMLEKTFHRRK